MRIACAALFAGLGPRNGDIVGQICCFAPVACFFLGPLVGVFLFALIYRRRPTNPPRRSPE